MMNIIKVIISGAILSLFICFELLAVEKTTTIVMLGDSTTFSSLNRPGTKLTDYVSSNLITSNKDILIINSGKHGDTVTGAYNRLTEDVFLYLPNIVTISFGLNDAMSLSSVEFRNGLERIVKTIQKRYNDIEILLITSTPFDNKRFNKNKLCKNVGDLDKYLDSKFCLQTRAIAKEYDLLLCDLHKLFSLKKKKQTNIYDFLVLGDGVHLTKEGNRLAAQYISNELNSLLDKQNNESNKKYDFNKFISRACNVLRDVTNNLRNYSQLIRILKTSEHFPTNSPERKMLIHKWNSITPKKIYLFDLTPLYTIGVKTMRKGVTYDNKPVIIQGTNYPKSISIHPMPKGQCFVEYEIGGLFKTFSTTLAITGKGKVSFLVYADDKLLYKSPEIIKTDKSILITLDVSDMNTLKLVIDKGKNYYGDQAVWCDPKLIK